MKEGFYNVALLGEVDDMFWFQWKHDDEFGNNVRQLRDPGLVEFHKILENINIYEDRMWGCMGLSTEGRFGADGVKLAEEWRGGITIAVE